MKNDKNAYRIFNSKGKPVKYETLLKDAFKAEIILFGELHNNPICHWLQLELARELYIIKRDDLIFGAEMFETDNASILSEYLTDQIAETNFEAETRLWPNYETDYKPLINFAKESNIDFVATNIPRRYASIVHRNGFKGLDNLNDRAKQFIAPLPIKYNAKLNCYKQMLEMMGEHADENLPKAQAIKDATMAYFILKNWSKNKTFLHFNGTYHSDNSEGIVWYLKQEMPRLKILTIASIEQDNIEKIDEESLGLANYILCIPDTMTKTH